MACAGGDRITGGLEPPSRGALAITVDGLDSGVAANLRVSGPAGYARPLTATDTLRGLVPGDYVIAATEITASGHTWSPSPAQLSTPVHGGSAIARATVSYVITTGALVVTISGLPDGVPASVTVTGPGGFNQAVTATRTFTGIAPGTYTLAASTDTSGGHTYSPSPASQSVTVAASETPATTAVEYALATGSLALTVVGLPAGTSADVAVTGPGGFEQAVTATRTFTGIIPGSYALTAHTVISGGRAYAVEPASLSVTVAASLTPAAATVTYVALPPATLNLRIDGLYLTQAAQRYDGSVPLVAGRDAYLRVFALANESNAVAPAVRVRLYSGGAVVQTYVLNAPGGGVPLVANEGSLAASWNVLVPAALVQPGLRVLADVDPANTIVEANESDNVFPAGGAPVAVGVQALPSFAVRFIPVLQQGNGLQGNVSAANTEQFLADLKKMLPVGAYDADLRAPYTTTAGSLQSDNANDAWGTILSEVLALRAADASTRYYYGVVKTGYTSGIAGIGYVGGSARTAIGWDHLPSGSSVMAHELGHNMGRQHAPCGGVAAPDPSYPHAGGQIGAWGLDLTTLTLKSPTGSLDLMGYCNPKWVSDYNWSAMVAYRQGGTSNSPGRAAAQTSDRGLLVWGRITERGPVLEPAFVVDAPGSLPAPGPHRLEFVGTDGGALRSLSFDAVELTDLSSGREEAFAFVLPLDRGLETQLASLRLTARGRTATLRAGAADAPPSTSVSREPGGKARLRWDAARYPMVLVRDAATGQVLSFARGGEVRLPVMGGRYRLTYSNGVRSRREDSLLR